MKQIFLISIFILFFISCDKNEIITPVPEDKESAFISAVDISKWPEISAFKPVFYDIGGSKKEFLRILKDNEKATVYIFCTIFLSICFCKYQYNCDKRSFIGMMTRLKTKLKFINRVYGFY